MAKADRETFRLGDRDYQIRFSVLALKVAKRRYNADFSLADLVGLTLATASETLPRMIWLSLLPSNPDLTEEEAEMLVMQSDQEAEIIKAVMVAANRFGEVLQDLGKVQSGVAVKKK